MKFYTLKEKIDKILTEGIGTNNSSSRDDWIIKELSKIPKGLKLLDAGAGEAKYKKFCKHLNYVSQDIAIYDGKGNSQGIQKNTRDYNELDIVSDIYNIPVKDNSFDVVLCTEVLEHLSDPINVFKELNRIMKKNGVLLLTAPFNSLVHYAPFHYSTGFTSYFYNFHLPRFGFKINLIEPNGNYFEYISQEIRRISSVTNKYSFLRVSFLTKVALKITLNFMNKANKNDVASSELLCYGYHIKATKFRDLSS